MYLRFCKIHKSSPEDVIQNLFLWSPHLELVPYTRNFLLPFLSLFSGHYTTSFEICIAILVRFSWAATYPSAPTILTTSWSLIGSDCPDLINHFSSLSLSPRSLFWSLLQTGFISLLHKSEWLKLWDHIITTGPEIIVSTLSAVILLLKTQITTCTSVEKLNILLCSKTDLNVEIILQKAYSILEKSKQEIIASVGDKLCAKSATEDGYPDPITLDQESRKILSEISPVFESTDNTESIVPEKSLGSANMKALAVSPPPLPRGRGYLRDDLRMKIVDKENVIPEVSPGPLDPLQPPYPSRYPSQLQNLPISSKRYPVDEYGCESIYALLDKAKLLRGIFQPSTNL